MTITTVAPEGWMPPHIEIEDLYPTDEALEIIENWPYDKAKELLYALKAAWIYPDYFEEHETVPGCFMVSTGGWSGHESMLSAMQENPIIWNQVWIANRRGGHYVFGTGYACFGGLSDRIRVTLEAEEQ